MAAINGRAKAMETSEMFSIVDQRPEPPIIEPTSPSFTFEPNSLKRKREGEDGYDAELERDRHLNDMRLKSRLEHIFSKYSRDFADIGDEVDIVTGEVVVDNGHLQHMRTDCDTGGNRKGRIAEMLAGDLSSTDEEDGDDDDPDATEDEDFGLSDAQSDMTDDWDTVFDDQPSANHNGDEAAVHDKTDVWNDAPLLPGDVGYDPFAEAGHRPGFSKSVLAEFESGVSNQLEQLVEALQKAQSCSGLDSASRGGLKPQITIDLDPNSATYGKPVITYVSVDISKRGGPITDAAVERQREGPIVNEKRKTDRPSSLAVRVLQRIADAGLPTVPGPDGKFPLYRNGAPKATKRQSVRSDLLRHEVTNADGIQPDPRLSDDVTQPSHTRQAVGIADGTEASKDVTQPRVPRNLGSSPPFTEEDDELILELKDNRKMMWEDIRDLFFKDRTVSAVQYRYYTYLKSDCDNHFTAEDDALLSRLRDQDGVTWPRIQREYFSDFSVSQLQYHYYSKLSQGQRPGWTNEQDELMKDLKDKQGYTWLQIQQEHFPEKTLGQIQYRYYQKCRPSDWKEQLTAATRAYDEDNDEVDDTPQAHRKDLTGASYRKAESGSRIWGIRRRLAGASTKLTATKVKIHAQKKEQRDAKARLEAEQLRVQEERRKARESQRLVKLGLLREADTLEATSPVDKLTPEALASTDQAEIQEAAIVSSEQTLPGQKDADIPQPRTVRQQYLDALARYQDYQVDEPEEGPSVLASSPSQQQAIPAEWKGDPELYEKALRMGPRLLPKPPQVSLNHVSEKGDRMATPFNQPAHILPNPTPVPQLLAENARKQSVPSLQQGLPPPRPPAEKLHGHGAARSSRDRKAESILPEGPDPENQVAQAQAPTTASSAATPEGVAMPLQLSTPPIIIAAHEISPEVAKTPVSEKCKLHSAKTERSVNKMVRRERESAELSSCTQSTDETAQARPGRRSSTAAAQTIQKDAQFVQAPYSRRTSTTPSDVSLESGLSILGRENHETTRRTSSALQPKLRGRHAHTVIPDSESDVSNSEEIDYEAVDASPSSASSMVSYSDPEARRTAKSRRALGFSRSFKLAEDDSADELNATEPLSKRLVSSIRSSPASATARGSYGPTPRKAPTQVQRATKSPVQSVPREQPKENATIVILEVDELA